MNYLTAGIVGAGVGILDFFLLLLAQKQEKICLFSRKIFYKQKVFWFLLFGMVVISVYFMWLIGDWEYLFGVELLVCGYLLPLCVTDWKYRILPDLFHIVYGVVFAGFKITCGTGYDLVNGGVSVLCVIVFLGAVHLLKRDQFGMGDLKLLCVCAFLAGMPAILWLFFRGLVIAGIYSVVQLLRHRADLKTEYPFVPFLLIGVLI